MSTHSIQPRPRPGRHRHLAVHHQVDASPGRPATPGNQPFMAPLERTATHPASRHRRHAPVAVDLRLEGPAGTLKAADAPTAASMHEVTALMSPTGRSWRVYELVGFLPRGTKRSSDDADAASHCLEIPAPPHHPPSHSNRSTPASSQPATSPSTIRSSGSARPASREPARRIPTRTDCNAAGTGVTRWGQRLSWDLVCPERNIGG